MGALEAEVLATLWSAGGPLTPSEVRDELDSALAYTTVMTILTRLWQKGRLERERLGRAYAYRPVTDEAGHYATRMRDTLAMARDREAALSRFVEALTPREAATLRELLSSDE